MLHVIVKKPNEEPERWLIPKTLQALQDIVQGHIEHVYIDGLNSKYVCYCNEDGKFEGLDPNFYLLLKNETMPYDLVVGNVVFVGDDGRGGDRSLTDEEMDELTTFIKKELVWY